MAENGLRFDPATAEAIGRAEARHGRSGRIALRVIALTLVWIAWSWADPCTDSSASNDSIASTEDSRYLLRDLETQDGHGYGEKAR